jgi:hypothetical protein
VTLAQQLQALEDRVAALERDRESGAVTVAPEANALWALDVLADQLEPPGGVLLVGNVDLPNGQRARWQQTRATPLLIDADLQQAAEVLAALGSPIRLRLLREVMGGRTTVQQLAATEGIGTTGQVYHHLRQLTASGWLQRTSGGAYEIPLARVVPLLGAILAAHA